MFDARRPTPGRTQTQEAPAAPSLATTSGATVIITDSLGDSVKLASTSLATLYANLADFKFV
jgi:hypothetical protein